MLSTDLGRAVIANSATQILLRQAPRPSPRSPKSSASPPENGRCSCRPAGARACSPRGRPRGCPSRPWPPRPSMPCAQQTRSSSQNWSPKRRTPGWIPMRDQVSPQVRRTRGVMEGRRYAGNPEHDGPGSAVRACDTPACIHHSRTITLPCNLGRSTVGTPCRQDCALSIWQPCPVARRLAHLGEGVGGILSMPCRAELEVMAARVVVFDPKVAAERDGAGTGESQGRGELGRGPVVLLLQVDPQLTRRFPRDRSCES